MDKMSLFAILTVSLPEVILDIYVAFVLTGLRYRLYPDKPNMLRLAAAVPLMLATQVISRAVLPNVPLILLVNIIFVTIILKFLYSLKWLDAFWCVVAYYAVLVTIELTYIQQFAKFMNKGPDNYFSSDMIRLICSMPERIMQVIIVISFWNWDSVYLNLKKNKKLMLTFSTCALFLFFTEVIFIYVFICYIDKMSLAFRIICSIGSLMFAIVNFMLCRTIIMLTKNTESKK